MTKHATSVRLTDEGKRLLAALARKFGISQASVLELLIRDKAKKEGIKNENDSDQKQ